MTTLTLNLRVFQGFSGLSQKAISGLCIGPFFFLPASHGPVCPPLVFLLLFAIHCIYNTHISTHMYTLKECSPFVMAQSCQVVTVLAIIEVLE